MCGERPYNRKPLCQKDTDGESKFQGRSQRVCSGESRHRRRNRRSLPNRGPNCGRRQTEFCSAPQLGADGFPRYRKRVWIRTGQFCPEAVSTQSMGGTAKVYYAHSAAFVPSDRDEGFFVQHQHPGSRQTRNAGSLLTALRVRLIPGRTRRGASLAGPNEECAAFRVQGCVTYAV